MSVEFCEKKPAFKKGQNILSNGLIGELLELWISGISIINIALKYNISVNTVSKYITQYYFYKSGENTIVIVKQSAINFDVNMLKTK